MTRVEFSRKNYKVVCDGCKEVVEVNTPTYTITLGAEPHEEQGEDIISLCEDCGNNLQNDINEEYDRFVGLSL